MAEEIPEKALEIMRERFGSDSLIAVATIEEDRPSVRTVNSYYENGAFYVITHALSGKMKQIASNPNAAICGDWFTAHGIGEKMCIRDSFRHDLCLLFCLPIKTYFNCIVLQAQCQEKEVYYFFLIK